jgi:hypothetical protein
MASIKTTAGNRAKVGVISDLAITQEIIDEGIQCVQVDKGDLGGKQIMYYFHPEMKVCPHFACCLCGSLILTFSGVYRHKNFCRVLKEKRSDNPTKQIETSDVASGGIQTKKGNRTKVSAISNLALTQKIIEEGMKCIPFNLGDLGGLQNIYYFHPKMEVVPNFACCLCGSLIRTCLGVHRHRKFCKVLKEKRTETQTKQEKNCDETSGGFIPSLDKSETPKQYIENKAYSGEFLEQPSDADEEKQQAKFKKGKLVLGLDSITEKGKADKTQKRLEIKSKRRTTNKKKIRNPTKPDKPEKTLVTDAPLIACNEAVGSSTSTLEHGQKANQPNKSKLNSMELLAQESNTDVDKQETIINKEQQLVCSDSITGQDKNNKAKEPEKKKSKLPKTNKPQQLTRAKIMDKVVEPVENEANAVQTTKPKKKRTNRMIKELKSSLENQDLEENTGRGKRRTRSKT